VNQFFTRLLSGARPQRTAAVDDVHVVHFLLNVLAVLQYAHHFDEKLALEMRHLFRASSGRPAQT